MTAHFETTGQLYTSVFSLLGICFILYFIFIRLLHPLAKIPGPLSASLTRLWMVQISRGGDMHRVMLSLHEKHGKLVRVGPNEVSVSDLAAIKAIYGMNFVCCDC